MISGGLGCRFRAARNPVDNRNAGPHRTLRSAGRARPPLTPATYSRHSRPPNTPATQARHTLPLRQPAPPHHSGITGPMGAAASAWSGTLAEAGLGLGAAAAKPAGGGTPPGAIRLSCGMARHSTTICACACGGSIHRPAWPSQRETGLLLSICLVWPATAWRRTSAPAGHSRWASRCRGARSWPRNS